METIRQWSILIARLFSVSSSHKRKGSVVEFLFLPESTYLNGTTDFDNWVESARSSMFPFSYSTTIVHEYVVVVDFSVVYKSVAKLLGKPFIVVPSKRK